MDRILERAFELARSGEVANLLDLSKRLKAEGFEAVAGCMTSRTLRRQLASTMRQTPPVVRARA